METYESQVEFKCFSSGNIWNSSGELLRRLNGFKWNPSGFPLQMVFKWKHMDFKWNSSVFQVEIYESQVEFKWFSSGFQVA